MKPPRYPRQALADVRRLKVEAAAERLAGAVRVRERAAEARRDAQELLTRHDEGSTRTRRDEARVLAQGELSAGDLARGAQWATRSTVERSTLVARLRAAETAESDALGAERAARESLGVAQAEAELIERDAARWRAGEGRKSELRGEEAMSEAWRRRR